jgi:hypothetical protein
VESKQKMLRLKDLGNFVFLLTNFDYLHWPPAEVVKTGTNSHFQQNENFEWAFRPKSLKRLPNFSIEKTVPVSRSHCRASLRSKP